MIGRRALKGFGGRMAARAPRGAKLGAGFIAGGPIGALAANRMSGTKTVAAMRRHPYLTGGAAMVGGGVAIGGINSHRNRHQPDHYLRQVRNNQGMGVVGRSIGGMTG